MIAIVLGLALQSTLADVFAGIAVGIERPFSIGDLVSVEGAIDGEVVQINWRSVQIRTDGNDLATVPNSVIAKSRDHQPQRSIARPGRQRVSAVRRSLEPKRVLTCYIGRSCSAPRSSDLPAPSVALVRVGRRRHEYKVGFSVARSGLLGPAKSNLFQQIMRQLRTARGQAAPRRRRRPPAPH